MSKLGTNYGQKYGANSLKNYFATAISPKITNNKWEGEIKGGKGDRINILTFGQVPWADYTGADVTFSDIPEIEGTMIVEKTRYNAFRILDWDKFKAYATDAESTETTTVADLLKHEVDSYNLGFYMDAAAGNWVGTDYTTGTVAVAVTTGVVTGSGTTFTAAMVGRPFKAAGHTKWYRVISYTSATSITIADDVKDITTSGASDEMTRSGTTYTGNVYTGGAIGAGATYAVQAATSVTVTDSTIDDKILALKEALDTKAADGTVCPKGERFLVIPSKIETVLLKSGKLTPYTPSAYEDVVKLGIIGMYRGFKVYVSEDVTGNVTDGYFCLAGHAMGITHAFVQVSSKVTTDLEANFGRGYKQLIAYTSKVLEARKKCLAVGYFKA